MLCGTVPKCMCITSHGLSYKITCTCMYHHVFVAVLMVFSSNTKKPVNFDEFFVILFNKKNTWHFIYPAG